MKRLLTIALAASLGACMRVPGPPPPPYHALGTEPFWNVLIDEHDITFIEPDAQPIKQPAPKAIIGVAGDVYDRYLVRVAEMRESTKICRQAVSRIAPVGEWAVDDRRIVPPPKDEVYTEMEALIQHFLIYSQGFTVPAGDAYVPVEGPRGEHGCYVVSDGSNRPWRVHMRSPGLMACQALHKFIVGGMIADVIAVIGSLDVVMGDVDR